MVKKAQAPQKKQPLKEDKTQNQQQTRLDIFIDRLRITAILVVVVIVIALISALYYVWWDFIQAHSADTARIWAIVATSLLVPFGLAGVVVGVWFGAQRSRWVLAGVDSSIDRLSASILKAGIEGSDVRVYAGRGLGILKRESRGSQEIYLPDLSGGDEFDGGGEEEL